MYVNVQELLQVRSFFILIEIMQHKKTIDIAIKRLLLHQFFMS